MRVAAMLLSLLIVAACGGESALGPRGGTAAVSTLLTEAELDGYARAIEPAALEFPRDHASHPQFKNEWWYFTGHLEAASGRAFGFQLTFFRIALAPADNDAGSVWRSRQAWMGHFAVTDPARGRFIHAERFSRDSLGLAGNTAAPFRVWIEDWSATAPGVAPFPLRLRAATAEAAIDLTLVDARGPVAHGDRGLDRKGPEPGNASYYYSMPRLLVDGELRLDGAVEAVTGSAWMDREWSTNALSPELAGWDWLALQLSDGRDLMLYRLRTHAGESSPFSGGTLIADDGRATRLGAGDFELVARDHWRSPTTGTRYPVGWTVELPAWNLRLEVGALMPNQEMNLTVRYWEGAVSARGTQDGRAVTGRGYLELTGY